MKYNDYGQVIVNTQDLFELLYKNPNLNLSSFQVEDPDQFNQSISHLHYHTDRLNRFVPKTGSIEQFDQEQQNNWYMPAEYHEMDIASWILSQCQTDQELERVGLELVLYQSRGLFPLLQYLKYLVDTMREHKVVWGVGRGSSTASYVLYLIGVHRIDSIRYNLAIEEFLK